jgi:hypothetical protein
MKLKEKKIYKAIDSISGVASKFAIANEYDKMMTAMGPKVPMLSPLLSKQFIPMMSQVVL